MYFSLQTRERCKTEISEFRIRQSSKYWLDSLRAYLRSPKRNRYHRDRHRMYRPASHPFPQEGTYYQRTNRSSRSTNQFVGRERHQPRRRTKSLCKRGRIRKCAWGGISEGSGDSRATVSRLWSRRQQKMGGLWDSAVCGVVSRSRKDCEVITG